jgi:hypothetical protein
MRQLTIDCLILSLITLLPLGGCVSKQEAAIRDARQFSEISVLNPAFQPKRGDKFAWFLPIIWSSEALPDTPELRQMLTQLVEQQLVAKGYQVVADQQQADYVIGAAIVDGNNQTTELLRNFFRLFPSLNRSQSGLPESMALVGVIRPEDVSLIGQINDGTSIALWRAAIKTFVLGENVTPQVREERFRTLAAKLMKSMP